MSNVQSCSEQLLFAVSCPHVGLPCTCTFLLSTVVIVHNDVYNFFGVHVKRYCNVVMSRYIINVIFKKEIFNFSNILVVLDISHLIH